MAESNQNIPKVVYIGAILAVDYAIYSTFDPTIRPDDHLIVKGEKYLQRAQTIAFITLATAVGLFGFTQIFNKNTIIIRE